MLTLYRPKLPDLWFRQALLADGETMSYNRAWGGTIAFPENDWADWYDYWVARPDGKRFYRYLADGGLFVGEVAYHYDPELDGMVADVIVYAPARGKGYGREGLRLLSAAAKESGVGALWDDLAIDNPALDLFLSEGFSEKYRTNEKIFLKKTL